MWRSTTGYPFIIGGGFVGFGYVTQILTVQLTVEVKLTAFNYGTQEAVYLSRSTPIRLKSYDNDHDPG